jgi:hypothetical protein
VKRFRPIVLVADIVCILTIALLCPVTTAQAKQCHAARPSNAQSYWSYRLIDGRKCWYEGRPGFSKSLLHWPAAQTAKTNPRPESDARPASAANKYNPLDAQASITSDPDAQLKPETADRIEPPSRGNLNTDSLHAWGSTKLAMAGEPVLTIMDRWPDQELQQQRAVPASAAQSSSANGGRTALMVIIMMMALSAVLMTTFRKKAGTWRLPFWPTGTSQKRTAAWY